MNPATKRLTLFFLLLTRTALAQTVPTAPNQLAADSSRAGAWVILYDQYGDETIVLDSMVFYRTLTFGPKGLPTGPVQDNFRSGKRRFTGQLAQLEPRPYYTGQCTWYYETGQKSREGHFLGGTPDSLYQEWNPMGELVFQALYKLTFGSGIQATVRVDKEGRAFAGGLQPPLKPQQTHVDYLTTELLPVLDTKKSDGASSILAVLWLSEASCRACVQRFSSKGSVCATDFKRLADTYAGLGYDKAGWFYEKALELASTLVGPIPANQAEMPGAEVRPQAAYREYLYDYAIYCARKRQFGKARHLLDQLITHTRAAGKQDNRGKLDEYYLLKCLSLYVAIGDYDRGRKLLVDQEYQLQRKTTGTDLYEVGIGYNERELVLRSFRQLRFQLDAKQGRFTNGRNTTMLIYDGIVEIILAQGDAYMRLKNYQQAEETYQRVAEQVNRNYTNLPEPYNGLGGRPQLQQKTDLLKLRYWPLVLKRLIDLYEKTGASAKAEPLVLELRKAYPDNLSFVRTVYMPNLNPRDKTKSDDDITDEAIENEGPANFNFVLKYQEKYPALIPYAYDNALMLKTLSYASPTDIVTKQLSEMALLDSRAKDVRRVLKPGEAAVEFVSFRQYTDHWTDTTLYAALVLRQGDPQIHLVRLCTAGQLKRLTNGYRSAPEAGINRLYSPRGGRVAGSDTAGVNGEQLYQLVWQPIAGWLRGVKTVYIAPAGELNKVSFAALPLGKEAVLSDSFQLHQVISSSSLILRAPVRIAKTDSVLLVGAIRYDVDSLQLTKLSKQAHIAMPRLPIAPQEAIKPLPGTAREIVSIAPLFTNARSLTGLAATEINVKQQTPAILHIATHGFYFPQQNPDWRGVDEYERTDTRPISRLGQIYAPLMRSGLLMAGASHVWRGGEPIRGVDDGILTAFEIANLKLTTTRLVVLSACETALGDVRGNEPVHGFQQAFKMAGVQNLLVSLWQVPDAETAEFMRLFYTYCVNDQLAISDAFLKTQQQMRKQYPQQPFKWASFVLVE